MNDNHSRLNKYEKRRKNTRAISVFIILGVILVLLLIALMTFGGNDKETEQSEQKDPNKNDSELVIQESDEEENENEKNESEDTSEDDDTDTEEDLEKESAEPSDENVSEAYTADWEPIGTEQEGEHTTQFKKESQDWKEMEQAASVATEIDEGDMTTWRIENGGAPDKTVATVSDGNETEVYRVYLTWINDEGWQPTKVEILKENDKK